MYKSAFKYAIALGIISSLVFYMAPRFGSNAYIDSRHLFIDISMFGLFLFFALYEFKHYRNDGILHFWQGMTVGFLVYLQASMLFSLFLLIYHAIDPSLLETYKTEALLFLRDKSIIYLDKFGEDAYRAQEESIAAVTYQSLVFQAFIKKIFVGMLITPVFSILIRKKPKS